MKAHLRFHSDMWWCKRLGFVGWGDTPQAAYYASFRDFFDAVRPVAQFGRSKIPGQG